VLYFCVGSVGLWTGAPYVDAMAVA
jgi:hypothetical protein